MSSFTKPLILEVLNTSRSGQGEFLLYEPFSYDIEYLGSGNTVTVPKGYNTDLCSVPVLFRWLIPISGKVAKPAVLHDYLYSTRNPKAIEIFEEALKVAEVSSVLRLILMFGVKYWASTRKIRDWLRN